MTARSTTRIAFLYKIDIGTTDTIVDGAANALTATLQCARRRLSWALEPNQAIAFNPILEALRHDDAASAAFAALDNEYEFFDAYEDLMPNYAIGATEVAATAIQQVQSATSNRMSAVRMQGMDEVSVWAQEIGYGLNRDPRRVNARQFRGTGFGFAAGIDGPTNNGGLFGLVSFVHRVGSGRAGPSGRADLGFVRPSQRLSRRPRWARSISTSSAVAGVGKMQSSRYVEIGDPILSALTEADWWATKATAPFALRCRCALGRFMFTPQAALTYAGISEEGYRRRGRRRGDRLSTSTACSRSVCGPM